MDLHFRRTLFCLLACFGIILRDIYNIIPNGLSLLIQICNIAIWTYFYTTRKKEKEPTDEEEKLQDEDNEH